VNSIVLGRFIDKKYCLSSRSDPLVASASDKGGDCCPLVADPKTVLVMIVRKMFKNKFDLN
jgi:hypothetical protein